MLVLKLQIKLKILKLRIASNSSHIIYALRHAITKYNILIYFINELKNF